MGTDSGVTPHGRNLEELKHMNDLGMSPIQVLESSTRIAAELMGVDGQIGTLEPAKRADLVIFRGTDLDLSELRSRVSEVYQDGQLVAGVR